jgi:hypothetical protein
MERSDHTANCPNIATPLQTAIAAAQKARVMIVLPWQKATNPLTAFCVAQLLDKRRCSMLMNYGDAFVAHSRNQCADVFLKSDMDWMLTLDDDLIVPFGNAEWYNAHFGHPMPDKFAGLNALDRLLSHGKTLVGGLYFGRSKFGTPMYGEGGVPSESEWARRAPHDVCKPTRWVATGCLLIHRSVFEDIEKKFPRLSRGNSAKGGQWFSSSEHALFECVDRTREMLSAGPLSGDAALKALSMLENGAAEARRNSSLGMGEDVQFCTRAKDAGHQPHVDCGLVLGHLGQNVWGPHNTSPKPRGT